MSVPVFLLMKIFRLRIIYETQVQLSQTFIQMCQIDNFERKQKKEKKKKKARKKKFIF